MSVRSQAEWEGLCRALGEDALLDDPRFRTLAARLAHRQALIAHLTTVFSAYPSAWWLQQLLRAGVPCGRFHTYDEMCVHPQVRSNSLMVELPTPHWGTIRVAGLPWTFGLTPGVLRHGPLPGNATPAVLEEILGETAAATETPAGSRAAREDD